MMTLAELKETKIVPAKIINNVARGIVLAYKCKDPIAVNLLNSMDFHDSVEKNTRYYAEMCTLEDVFEAFGESGVAQFIGIGPYAIDILMNTREAHNAPKILIEVGYGFNNDKEPTFTTTIKDIKSMFGSKCSDDEIEIRMYDDLPMYVRRNNA